MLWAWLSVTVTSNKQTNNLWKQCCKIVTSVSKIRVQTILYWRNFCRLIVRNINGTVIIWSCHHHLHPAAARSARSSSSRSLLSESLFFPSSFISSDGLDFELSSPGRSLCHDGGGSALSSSAHKLHGSWDKGIPWSDVVSRPRLSHHQCLNKQQQQQQNSACVSNYTTHYSLHRRWPPFRFERLCAIPYKVYTL